MAELKDAKPRFVDSLLDNYAPAAAEFVVTLPEGEALKFRALMSSGELADFKAALMNWLEFTPYAGSPKAAGHVWEGFLPANAYEATAAFTISHCSVEPKFSQIDALKLLKAPWLVEFVMDSVDRANRTMKSLFELKLLEHSKNESWATDGSEPASQSPETPLENTRTA